MMIYSLKLECEKLASEKIEIQRHYVMVSSLSFIFFSSNLTSILFLLPPTYSNLKSHPIVLRSLSHPLYLPHLHVFR